MTRHEFRTMSLEAPEAWSGDATCMFVGAREGAKAPILRVACETRDAGDSLFAHVWRRLQTLHFAVAEFALVSLSDEIIAGRAAARARCRWESNDGPLERISVYVDGPGGEVVVFDLSFAPAPAAPSSEADLDRILADVAIAPAASPPHR